MLSVVSDAEYVARRERLGIFQAKPIVRREKPKPLPPKIIPSLLSPHVVRERDFIHIETKEALREEERASPDLTWRDIVSETARKYGLTTRQIIGSDQSNHVSMARQECFYRLSKELGYSTPRIGSLIGGRDHSTVFHGIKRHQNRIDIAEGRAEAPKPMHWKKNTPHPIKDVILVGEMRRVGMNYAEIEEELGYTPQQASGMYRRYLKLTNTTL